MRIVSTLSVCIYLFWGGFILFALSIFEIGAFFLIVALFVVIILLILCFVRMVNNQIKKLAEVLKFSLGVIDVMFPEEEFSNVVEKYHFFLQLYTKRKYSKQIVELIIKYIETGTELKMRDFFRRM